MNILVQVLNAARVERGRAADAVGRRVKRPWQSVAVTQRRCDRRNPRKDATEGGGGKRGARSSHAVHLVALLEEELGEVRAVLTSDTCACGEAGKRVSVLLRRGREPGGGGEGGSGRSRGRRGGVERASPAREGGGGLEKGD